MRITFLALLVITAACAPVQQPSDSPSNPPPPAPSTSAGNVHFGVERVSAGIYRLSLDNGAPHAIGYNLCSSILEKREGSAWKAMPGDICTMEIRTLNPGFDATFEKRPGTLAAGEYRYATRIESPMGSAPVTITTAPFTVR